MHPLTADGTELAILRRRLADQALALEILTELPSCASVDAARETLLTLVGNLCGAASAGLVDPAGDTHLLPLDGAARTAAAESVAACAQLLMSSPMSWWRRGDDFAIEVGGVDDPQGILVVLSVGMPEHIDEYVNLLLGIAPAIAAGLRDATRRSGESGAADPPAGGEAAGDLQFIAEALARSPIPSGLLAVSAPGAEELVSMNDALRDFLGIDPASDAQRRWAVQRLCAGMDLSAMGHLHIETTFHAGNDGDTRWGLVCLSRFGDDRRWQALRLVQVIDTSESRRINDALQHQAEHNPVSDLPNRALLVHTLDGALRNDRRHGEPATAVILFDLDDFKSVNRGLGHEAGNTYLRCVADALVDWARPQDFAAHLGSDEFALVLPGVRDSSTAAALAESLRARLAAGVHLAGATVSAAASIGVAVSTKRAGAASLLAMAEQAMFTAKQHGGNQWQLATTGAAPDAPDRVLRIEADMRAAIADDEFELRYQPVIDIVDTGHIVGVEALLRWEHPTLGRMMPGEFIPVAERRSLMSELGAWVVATACRQAAAWQDTFGLQAPHIAINVSTRQLGSGAFLADLHRLLRANHLDVDRISLEVTESQLLRATGPAADELRAIAETGVHIAIDDFGTGYAGFDYLRHLPIGILKIDKSFIDNIASDATDRAILAGITALGHTLGLTLIAEGVETPEQLAVARDLGCQQAQGWLWRPALRPADVAALFGVDEQELRVR